MSIGGSAGATPPACRKFKTDDFSLTTIIEGTRLNGIRFPPPSNHRQRRRKLHNYISLIEFLIQAHLAYMRTRNETVKKILNN